MGYDFSITKGSVRPGQEESLCSEMARFAGMIDLECGLIQAKLVEQVTEVILFGGDGHENDRHPIHREWRLLSQMPGLIEKWAAPVDGNELVRGIVIFHPYEAWLITWNCSKDRTLAGYPGLANPERVPPENIGRLKTNEVSPATIFAMWGESHIVMASTNEGKCEIHVPWRKSDVAQALDFFKIIESHCEDFEVHDDYGTWQGGMDSWRNPLSAWCEKLGGQPAHPDPTDLLDADDTKPPQE